MDRLVGRHPSVRINNYFRGDLAFFNPLVFEYDGFVLKFVVGRVEAFVLAHVD
jgi:hypothetical protein